MKQKKDQFFFFDRTIYHNLEDNLSIHPNSTSMSFTFQANRRHRTTQQNPHRREKQRKLINLESGFPAQSCDSFVECFKDSSGKKLLGVDGTLLLSATLINHGLCGLSPQNHRYRFLRRYLSVPQFLPLLRFPLLQLLQLPRYSPSTLVHHRQRRRGGR